jgi:subtilisin family serine protease
MRRPTRKGLTLVAVVGLIASFTAGSATAAGPTSPGSGPTSTAARPGHAPASLRNIKPSSRLLETRLPAGVPSHGRYAFLLRLSTASTLATYRHNAPSGKSTAASAARSQFAQIKARQANVIAALPRGSRVLFKTHAVLAAVAVTTNVRNYGALRGIGGVQAVYPIARKSADNSYAMPLQHAPQAWQAHGDLGENSTIAIIDTGVDYTHANLGGSGDPDDYDTAHANETSDPTYPDPDKIVGGYDFVGDAYNADDPDNDTPAPDENPIDCNGHGSHVAGIAAGYGENPDGSTFTDDYLALPTDISDFQDQFRIGPGMAPLAHLLAYKVFGCEGSTNVVAEAIDRAADPDQDGDPSDHADVINMSLGADFGSPLDGDSVASNVASQLGITVAVASGNGGDLYDVGGSPGDATRVIAAANSIDAYNQIDTLHATIDGTPEDFGAQRSVAYDWESDPDLSGDVVALSDDTNLDGCDPLNATDEAAVDGKIAFLEWTDDDATRRCGSAARSANIVAAGGVGAILADDQETFAAGITGSAVIPVVEVVKSAGDTIRDALGNGDTVTVTGTSAGDFSQILPGDDDKVNSGSSRGIHGSGNVKPDVAAVGTSVFSTSMGTGNEGVSFTGTSMATPMVAGLAALVKSLRADWTPEEVKADIMNTAGQDLWTGDSHTGTKYAPNRVGAGRIEADAALDNLVVAYVQDDPGAVSVSFGPVAITGATTLTKTVKVVNKSLHDATYSLAYQAITTVPGVSYQVSQTTLTVASGDAETFTVKLVVTNRTSLTKTHDATVDTEQAGLPREFQADASGRVVLTPDGANDNGATGALRVPVYSAPRPASSMTEAATLTLPGSGVQKASLALAGTGVNQGSGIRKVRSLVAGFELQARSGAAPICSDLVTELCVQTPDDRAADIKYIGTTSDSPLVKSLGGDPIDNAEAYFAITSRGAWRTPAGPQEFDVFIDTNGDDEPDAIVYNTRFTDTDIFVSVLLDFTDPANAFVRDVELINDRFGDFDTALFDSDSMILPVYLGALGDALGDPALPGFDATHTRINYGVVSFGPSGVIDAVGVDPDTFLLDSNQLTTNLAHPGVEVYNSSILTYPTFGLLLNTDTPGSSLTVRRDVSRYSTDAGLGALLIHFQNKVGSKAKVVTLKTKPSVSLKLSKSSISLGHSISATVTVANTGGITPTGKVTLRREDGSKIKSGNLSGGKITFTWTPGKRGTFKVYATYAGDSNYASGKSAKVTYTVT